MEAASTFGTLLVSGLFAWSGVEHFLHFRPLAQLLSARLPAPGLFLAAASVLEIVAGSSLAAGVARPYAAGCLVVFTIAASCLLLDFWHYTGEQRQSLRSGFLANVAVIGGLLLAGAR